MFYHRSKFFFTISVTIIAAFFWTGCGFTRLQKNNILVIAVDNLGVNDVNCTREAKPLSKSGLDILCKNAVRFTHAYSPSLLSEPAMASILTGLYPFENHVHNNATSYLRVSLPNIATAAYQQGYKTAFFSGGPPALRSSGFQQGFELFEDNINPTIKLIFRPADVTFPLFTTWAKEVDSSFLAMMYVPDLLFKDHQTTDEFGEKRNLSRESQIDNFDNNLGMLFSQMKKQKIWDQTNIILVGLNGQGPQARSLRFPKTDLRSEQTQISLLIKPAGKPRDEGLSWSFDEPVTLADLGVTIFDWIEFKPAQSSKLPLYSLAADVLKPVTTPQKQRWLYAESYWGPWQKKAGPSFSLRKNNVLFWQAERPHFYNTLTDRMEAAEIPANDSSILAIKTDLEATEKVVGISREEVALEWHSDAEANPIDEALTLVTSNNWKSLEELGKQMHKADWTALAERNLGFKKTNFSNPCLQLIDLASPNQDDRRFCTDKNSLVLADYINSLNAGEAWNGSSTGSESTDQANRDFYRKKISNIVRDELLFSHLNSENKAQGEIWYISEHKKTEHLNFELALRHPRANKLHLIQ